MFNYSNEINLMTPVYTVKLQLNPWKIYIRVEKIDDYILKTYGMVSTIFSLQDSWGRLWFFMKIFLLINISIEIVLEMSFLYLNNANNMFAELRKLT